MRIETRGKACQDDFAAIAEPPPPAPRQLPMSTVAESWIADSASRLKIRLLHFQDWRS
ncbi:MAG: hypothetical protein MUF49_07920 [Oculatellaceae cyanobacterium Prado106]|nr:hypothetical protein [Oculatellaceae cyanobacterium Prado106]